MLSKQKWIVSWLALSAMIVACSDGSSHNNSASPDPSMIPFQELYDQGVDRYLGVFTPMTSDILEGGITQHSFGGDEGPLCFTGNEYSMSTRDGASEELMIFLQGGGACGPENCQALETGIPLIDAGILEAGNPANPATDFNLGYLPYCDGTTFTGDREVDSNGDGSNDRFFRGIQNLSASLDVIARTYPAPTRILLAGNSAGGTGVHYALPLIRKLYPEVPIELVHDSDPGIREPGSQESLNDYWNSAAFFPASCSNCIGDDGNLTGYYEYQLAEDDNVRMGFVSSTRDNVITGRSGIPGPVFEAQLLKVTADLEEAYPERFRSLISDTDEHTFIIKQFDFPVSNTTVRQWIADMLSLSDNWVSKSD